MIAFHVFLDGQLHGLRSWPWVPRVGDEIWVGKALRDGDRTAAAWCKVDKVRWVDDGSGGLYQVGVFVTVCDDEQEAFGPESKG